MWIITEKPSKGVDAMSAILHYTMNDAYQGYENFAFGLNLDLRWRSPEVTANPQKQAGLAELDACFPVHSGATGTVVLYRGASLYDNSPEKTPEGLFFRHFLSTSYDISTASRFADIAERHDGRGCLFRITYPKRLPLVDVSAGDDEKEVILPRGLVCRWVEWKMTDDEALRFGFSMSRGFENFMGLEVTGVQPGL